MDRKNIDISVLKESDIDEINKFYNSIYKSDRNRNDFLWEFYNAPAGKAIYIVAKDSDNRQIVGTQCAIPIELVTNKGDIILTAKSEDTLVHPDYRGLNIFENMYNMLFEECRRMGIRYIWGFTSAKKPFIKLGFTIPFDQSQSLMVFDVFSSFKYLSKLNSRNNFVSRFKIFALCIASKIYSYKRFSISSKLMNDHFNYSVNHRAILQDDHELLELSNDGDFAIKLDLSFLNWRISNNPHHEKLYNVYVSSNAKTLAHIIFNYHKDGIWYLINDIYSKRLNNRQRSLILKKAVKILLKNESDNVKLIRTWDFTHNEHGKLEIKTRSRTGFFHIDRGVSFVWKGLDDSNLLDVNKFHLSRIATQGVI